MSSWFSIISYFCVLILFQICKLCVYRVGIDIPKIEVRYEHLSIEGDTYDGSRALPTLWNATINFVEVLFPFNNYIDSEVQRCLIFLVE